MPSNFEAITPRGLHTHGKEFFTAAEAVYSMPSQLPLPLAFLWGRSIELLLKSYLLSVGVTTEQLRSKKFGHNLKALHGEAIKHGIEELIGAEDFISGLMQILNHEYASKRLEYRESGTRYLIPDVSIARLVIERLIHGIHQHLKQHGT